MMKVKERLWETDGEVRMCWNFKIHDAQVSLQILKHVVMIIEADNVNSYKVIEYVMDHLFFAHHNHLLISRILCAFLGNSLFHCSVSQCGRCGMPKHCSGRGSVGKSKSIIRPLYNFY